MEQRNCTAVHVSRRSFHFFGWLWGYDRPWLRFDVIAALTTWALVVLQSIAYGQIAGLPPQAGLFTAFAALLGYAIFGRYRRELVESIDQERIFSSVGKPVAVFVAQCRASEKQYAVT